MDDLDAVAASGLASASILAALVQALLEKNLLSTEEVHEIYEAALLMMEEQQPPPDEPSAHIFEMAREVIEEHLRPDEI